MSLEATLKTVLGPTVGGRVTPDVTPDNPVFPLIVYQQVGGEASVYLDNTLPDHEHARIQIYVWAKTRVEASRIARDVAAALVATNMPLELFGAPISDYQDTLKIYGSRRDVGIWYVP